MTSAASPQGRRILVAVVTGPAGDRLQAWREQHDPREAQRLPPHTTLCYWAPAVEPGLLRHQVEHAFNGGVEVTLGGIQVFDNDQRTLYVAVEEHAALDAARRRLYDATYLPLPGYNEWTWHITCIRESRGRDLQPLLDAAQQIGPLGRWKIDRVAYLELQGERYEAIANFEV